MSVTLYSTGCPMCRVLKQKLDKKDIPYNCIEDSDIMIKKGFKSAPQLEVDSLIFDFNKARKLIDAFDNTLTFESFVLSQSVE